jgi:hypothetical protein
MDSLFTFFLLLTKQQFIIPFVIVGFYLLDAPAFFRSLIALLGTMVLAAYLKTVFQVPLKPHLGSGWALPSGHMMAATVFWGVLVWELKQRLFAILLPIVLVGIAVALIHFNYHDPIDVLAAAGFGFAVVIFHIIAQRSFAMTDSMYASLVLCIAGGIIFFGLDQAPMHVITATATLGGLFISELLFRGMPTTLAKKIVGIVLCLALVFGIFFGINYFTKTTTQLVLMIQNALMGLSLRFSAHVSSRI